MPRFHVFLSHNSSDKPAVRALKQALAGYELNCWLDEEQLRPGLPWQDLLEQGIKGSGSVAVCVAGDGLGPWEKEEMQGALRLAVRDGRPIIPVLLPNAPEQPELPMFLENRTWVDLRAGLKPAGLAMLVWGITGEKPVEGRVPRKPSPPPTHEAPTPSEATFLDEVFERLYTYPTLILLAQEGRDQRSSLDSLRRRSEARHGTDKVLYLVPPRNPNAREAEFFRALGKRAGMNPPAQTAMDFENYLDDRLAGGERLFLLISGLAKCSDEGREQLADTLRGLSDVHDDALNVVLVGGEKLAALKYAQGHLSLLNHAEPLDWPELNVGDLLDLARRARPPLEFMPEAALTILEACGGHPRLIQDTLRCLGRGQSIEECSRGLSGYKQIRAEFSNLAQDPDDASRLMGWLDQSHLGPYREWIKDPLLRQVYWKNLLRAAGPVGRERLVWRCPAVVEAGRKVLE